MHARVRSENPRGSESSRFVIVAQPYLAVDWPGAAAPLRCNSNAMRCAAMRGNAAARQRPVWLAGWFRLGVGVGAGLAGLGWAGLVWFG